MPDGIVKITVNLKRGNKVKKVVSVVVCLCFLILSGSVFAEQPNAGSGQKGVSLLLGYDAAYLHYVETTPLSGGDLDKDTGWQNGGFGEIRYDLDKAFARLNVEAIGSNSADYKGSLQNGTPLSMKTKERIYKTELDAAYKLWNESTATLSPYIGAGYRYWKRGEDVLPDYTEKYTWWYAALGANYAYKYNRWMFGIDAAFLWPFSMKMETNVSGLIDDASFHIKPRLGFRIELPTSCEVYRTKGMQLSVFGTPYYEQWNIGQSSDVTLTQGGVPVGTAVEPKSNTELYGIKIGLGINF